MRNGPGRSWLFSLNHSMMDGDQKKKERIEMKKKQADHGQIYSVVDLETTGTNVKEGDRIIHIGCLLICDGEIINRFETKVNPLKPIPRAITQLTGISNQDVEGAPIFEDLAPVLASMLADTVFVAHNVNFDFPFLNAELMAAGEEPLRIPAVDTVTLSQLLYPSAKSYRLRDLSANLKIEHDQPHSAISDAEATAHLLVDLLTRLHQLPTLTLEKLVGMELVLPQQTKLLFERELRQRKRKPQPLSEALYVSHGLVLHKKRPLTMSEGDAQLTYPMTKRQKIRLYRDQLTYRPIQAKMMNAIYNSFIRDEARQVMIEAGTGVGKTLGYLLPLTYLAVPNGKIIVSTATNLLQGQLLTQGVTQLKRLLPGRINAVTVKGNSHYLSLSKFAHSLTVDEDSQLSQFLKAKILIWLLQTTTGDLEELNLNAQQIPYLSEVSHTGLINLSTNDPFYRDDFLVSRQRQLRHANVIITNHAYLVAHAAELGTLANETYLVVDEAQHLATNAQRESRQQITFNQLRTAINQLQILTNPSSNANLVTLFTAFPIGSYHVELLRNDLVALKDLVEQLTLAFLTKVNQRPALDGFIEQVLTNDELAILLDPSNPLMESFEQAVASLKLHFTTLHHLFNDHAERWLGSDRYLMNQFASQLSLLTAIETGFQEIRATLEKQEEAPLFWLTMRAGSERSTLVLTGGNLIVNHFLRERVYAHFNRQLFVGATLFTSNKSAFIFDQLDLEREKVKVKRLPVAFDYEHQARLLMAMDAPSPTEVSDEKVTTYLAQTIAELAEATNCQTIVLFNSLQTIEQVYTKLRQTSLFNQRDILAQGINGNRDKLLKQFSTGQNTVLLGAASFWEGIDLPDNQLQLLIITRLPFEAPNRFEHQARHELLKRARKNPFYHYELPQAMIRLRQGVGRLLRTPTDSGVVVVLDPRITTKRYGKSMQNALPSALNKENLKTSELAETTATFLAQKAGKVSEK